MSQMSEADIPIDIHYNKLLDWLISRRHCKQQWQGAALTIREKINAAIQDMPPHPEITQLLHGTYINYFHCLRIVELLKETESGTKNIFGRYSSQRMKDWLEIVKLYEQDEVYLAEAAQLLTRNVNYEIPALKRQVTKCQQAQKDCTRKEAECASNAAELKEKYNASCKQMGIQGRRVKSELMGLVQDLPSVYDRLGETAANLNTAVNYYATFVAYTLKNDDLSNECIPLVKYLSNKGNTTVYEWRTGSAPSRIEAPTLDLAVEEEETGEEQTEEIDWGNIDTDGGIDFSGISLEGGADGIDWGITEGSDAAGDGIDWGSGDKIDIEVVEDSVNEGPSEEEGVARGTDAVSVLDHTDTRNTIINEMLELEAFLGQRLQELQGGDNVLASSQFQSAPATILVDPVDVQAMLTEVQGILHQLNSPRMQDLILIRSSPRYVDRLSEKLKKTLESSEKMLSMSRLMVTRRQEAAEEEKQIEPKLDLIRDKTKQLQTQISSEISKKYHNRRVNIMGEINTI